MTASPPVASLLQDPDFRELKRWIISATGLSYYVDKDQDLAAAVLRSQGGAEKAASEILVSLARTGSITLDRLVEELTIGETFFFRHLEMFHALRDHVFPDLLKRRAGLRALRIWSAGCSVGAEPYSIAILFLELLGQDAGSWKIDIIATDINRRFLTLARAGVYDVWALRGLPKDLLQRRFQKVGSRWMLDETCRKMVRFRHHNLVSDKFPSIENELSGLDLIICRNVVIYFDGETIRKMTEQFFRSLVPGGWLAVGHSEPHTDTFRAFHTINAPGAVLYQRPAEGNDPRQIQKQGAVGWVPPHVPVLEKKAPPEVSKPSAKPQPVPARSERLAPIAKEGASSTLDARHLEISRLADQGDLQEACRKCEALTLLQPLAEGPHFQLGLLLFQLGLWDKAGRALKCCLYLKRDLAIAHYYLGLVQLSLGESALRSFKNAFKLIRRIPDDEVQPWGDGLTAAELRTLIKPYLENGETDGQ